MSFLLDGSNLGSSVVFIFAAFFLLSQSSLSNPFQNVCAVVCFGAVSVSCLSTSPVRLEGLLIPHCALENLPAFSQLTNPSCGTNTVPASMAVLNSSA
jgi:hypothetical protein